MSNNIKFTFSDVILPEEYFDYDFENLVMTRTDFNDSSDDAESESELSSSQQQSTEIVTNSNKKTEPKKNNSKKEDNDTYSKEMMANTNRYEDVNKRHSIDRSKCSSVYDFTEETNEDDVLKQVSTRSKKQHNKKNGTPAISVGTYFLNGSLHPDSSDTDGLRTMNPAYVHKKLEGKTSTKSLKRKSNTRVSTKEVDDEEKIVIQLTSDTENMIKRRRTEIQRKNAENQRATSSQSSASKSNSKTANQTIPREVKKRQPKKSQIIRDEIYITENENRDSMHQESDEYNDEYDEQYSANPKHARGTKNETKKKAPTKARRDQNENSTDDEEWHVNDQENFLFTLKEQPIQELTQKEHIRWAMFAKRLSEFGTHRSADECKKQVMIYSKRVKR